MEPARRSKALKPGRTPRVHGDPTMAVPASVMPPLPGDKQRRADGAAGAENSPEHLCLKTLLASSNVLGNIPRIKSMNHLDSIGELLGSKTAKKPLA